MRARIPFAILSLLLLAAGCDERERTAPDGDLPWVDAGGGGCVPATCAARGAQCGQVLDGCGGVLECGACAEGESCGVGGANRCGAGTCVARSCEGLEAECGTVSDGCAALLDCGSCGAGLRCGGDNRCGSETCTPTTCAALGASCGAPDDGCGGVLDCGGCAIGQTCGLETPFVCGGECTADVHCGDGRTCDVESATCRDACVGPSDIVTVDVPYVDITPNVTLGGGALATIRGGSTSTYPSIRFVNELGSFGFPLYRGEGFVTGEYQHQPNTSTLRVVPGTYEVRFDAAATNVDGFGVFPITDAVLDAELEVTAGGEVRLDVPVADITPMVTLAGAGLATIRGGSTSTYPSIRFVNELGSFGFPLYRGEGFVTGEYQHQPNTRTLRVVPGTYEVRFDAAATNVDGFEIFPITDAVLDASRAVTSGPLSVDVPVADVAPNVTLGGGALATIRGGSTSTYPSIRFVNELGSFGFPLYRGEGFVTGEYQHQPNTSTLRVVPGTYEVRFDAAATNVDGFEIFPITDAVLDASRAVTSGPLSVNVPFLDVSPSVTLGGGALATIRGGSTSTYPSIRFVNELGSFGFPLYRGEGFVTGEYQHQPNTSTLRVVPGTYEVRFDAAATNVDGFEIFPITDAVLDASRAVTSGPLSVDVPVADVAPNVTLGGGALATIRGGSTSTYPSIRFVNELGSFGFPLYRGEGFVTGEYQHQPNTRTLRVVPGTYEVRFDAAATNVDGFEIFPITDAVLDASRAVTSGPLSVNVPFLDVSPSVTLGGGALATIRGGSTSTYPSIRFVNELGSFGFPLYRGEGFVTGEYQHQPNTSTLRVVPGTYEVRFDAAATNVDGFEIFPITDAVLFCQQIDTP